MQKRIVGPAVTILSVLGGVIYFGFGVETSVSMPGYAVVFVDDGSGTIVAPQCAVAWQHKPTKTLDVLRRTTAREAEKLRYKLDYDCIQTGAFAPSGPSLSGLILEKVGVLPPRKYWWDMPYRTEQGVVHPRDGVSAGAQL